MSDNDYPKIDTAARAPEFMKEYAGQGVEKIGPEDLTWIGHDGDKDVDDILRSYKWRRREIITRLLIALIELIHEDDSDNKDRVAIATEHVLGLDTKPGNRARDDDILLMDIAEKYFDDFWSSNGQPVLGTIIRSLLMDWRAQGKIKGGDDDETVIKRLRRKFAKDCDLYLARVSLANAHSRPNIDSFVQATLQGIRRIEIS